MESERGIKPCSVAFHENTLVDSATAKNNSTETLRWKNIRRLCDPLTTLASETKETDGFNDRKHRGEGAEGGYVPGQCSYLSVPAQNHQTLICSEQEHKPPSFPSLLAREKKTFLRPLDPSFSNPFLTLLLQRRGGKFSLFLLSLYSKTQQQKPLFLNGRTSSSFRKAKEKENNFLNLWRIYHHPGRPSTST
jgi:hypothetical protein